MMRADLALLSDLTSEKVTVDPSGLLVVTTTNVQAALAELDAAVHAVPNGGSALGAPCWFVNDGNIALPAAANTNVPWLALDDGVAVGTDVTVSGDTLTVVTAGTYLVSVSGAVQDSQTGLSGEIMLNDDSVGPAYYLSPILSDNHRHFVIPALTLQLAIGDTLKVPLNPSVTTTNSTCAALLHRLG